jgi:hypothetical protein
MKVFNYVIQVSDYGVNRLINISIKADTIVKANMAIMVDIVNANYRNHDSNQYSLHSPRLVSIKE